ncbi:MAG: hypothetical protein ACI89U_000404 [Gammaproteobacteria bacterium]|jgi:hypothetical protein
MTEAEVIVPIRLGKRLLVSVSSDLSDLFFAKHIARRFKLPGIVPELQREPLTVLGAGGTFFFLNSSAFVHANALY